VQIEVDTRLVEAAALRAVTASAALGELARAAGRVAGTVRDPHVVVGLAALADVVADACAVVALDLELVSRLLHSGALDYAATEAGAVPGPAGE
jgi:hypothetical protein